MLKVYDTTHYLGLIEDSMIRNLKRTDIFDDNLIIMSYLSFDVPYTKKYYKLCELENYIINYDGSYVIKEVRTIHDNWIHVQCEPNLESWTNKLMEEFSFVVPDLDNTKTFKDLMNYLLSFTGGWTCTYMENDIIENKSVAGNLYRYNESYITPMEMLIKINIGGDFIVRFDTHRRNISIMSYSYWWNWYAPAKIFISNQTGVEKVSVDKNSYNLVTQFILSGPVSPVLYPDKDYDPVGYMKFENPILRNYQFTDKQIQKLIHSKKVTDRLLGLIEEASMPSIAYVISGGLVDIKEINIGQRIGIYDTTTQSYYITTVQKLEYNYQTPQLSKLYVYTNKMTLDNYLKLKVSETENWIESFKAYIQELYPDAEGHFYDPYSGDDI